MTGVADIKTVPELVWTRDLTHLLLVFHTGRAPVSYIDLGVEPAPNKDGKDHRWTVVAVSSRLWLKLDKQSLNICKHGDRPGPVLFRDVWECYFRNSSYRLTLCQMTS